MNRPTIIGSLVLAGALALTTHAQPPPGSTTRVGGGRGSAAGRAVLAQPVPEPATQPPTPSAAVATRVRVDVGKMRARAIEVEQPSGRGSAINTATQEVLIKPWQYIASHTGTDVLAVAPPAGQTQAWSLPVVITTANEAGTQLDLEIVVTVANGLMLRGSDGVYSGDVFVGVTNKQNRAATDPLGAPVHVLLAGEVDTIDPASGVEIKHTNLPYERVSLRARPTGDQVLIRARASFASEDAEVPIRVVRPHLILRASPSRIQGYGLETTDIIVQSDGHPRPEGLAVTVVTSDGRMEPDGVLTLNGQGVATARLRGNGLGLATVTASGAGFRDAEFARVEFQMPRLFVGAVLLGGLAGGFLKYRKRRRAKAGLATALLLGMIQGAGVAALYAIGINVLGWAPTARTGAAMAFASAFLGVWVDLGALVKKWRN